MLMHGMVPYWVARIKENEGEKRGREEKKRKRRRRLEEAEKMAVRAVEGGDSDHGLKYLVLDPYWSLAKLVWVLFLLMY
ncbi:unnamed protein product [Musa hybrid cultivar]